MRRVTALLFASALCACGQQPDGPPGVRQGPDDGLQIVDAVPIVEPDPFALEDPPAPEPAVPVDPEPVVEEVVRAEADRADAPLIEEAEDANQSPATAGARTAIDAQATADRGALEASRAAQARDSADQPPTP